MKNLMEFMELAGTSKGLDGSDGINTFLTLNHIHTEPFLLKSENKDELSFTIAEDLRGLLQFRISAGCKIEQR